MVVGEVRMLIDGELVEAGSGKRFANVNPATEEILGEVADADATDMARAIDAARRAFDDTDWSTNKQLRKRCLQQLQDAFCRREGADPPGARRRGRHPGDADLRRPARLAA
jgi:aldehyde dehydrogenase (NAD+)